MFFVFVDFSDASLNALSYACCLANLTEHKKVLLINIPDLTNCESDDIDDSGEKKVMDEAYDKLRRLIHFADPTEKLNIESYVAIDFDENILLELVDQKGATMIFTGVEKKSKIAQALQGSPALDLMELFSFPQMLVPQGYKTNLPKRIVVPVAFDDKDESPDFTFLTSFAKEFNCSLTFLHVSEKGENLTRFVLKKSVDIPFEIEQIESEDVAKSILDFLCDSQADIVAVFPRSRTMLGIMEKSTTHQLVRKCAIPLLALPGKKMSQETDLIP